MYLKVITALTLLGFPAAGVSSASAPPRELRWAGDPEGGAPFVQANPADPTRLTGFDVEIASRLARGLGRIPQFVFVQFTSIDQSVERDDADIGLSGIEDTPTRRAVMCPTIPYYEFREVLTVRDSDVARLRTLADFAGRRVATLAGTIAYEILLRAEGRYGIQAVSYEDDVHPYEDLRLGRVDGVLLDNVLAERRRRETSGITVQPGTVAVGHYVGILASRNGALREAMNESLRAAMRDGSLERILRKWGVWNEDQPRLYARLLAGKPVPPISGVDGVIGVATLTRWQATRRYLPSLIRAAGVTLLLSCLSMALAVCLGVLIASGRVYGTALVRLTLTGYVELMR